MQPQTQPFDAVLFLSFGGPEGPDDVRPFLENVTRGRGIPPERLDEVGAHYFNFGGKSPLNDLNRDIIDRLETALKKRGFDMPIYFGNRNWHPFAEEAAERLARDGHRNVVVFATSAWGGYSGCRQYNEDIQRIRQHLKDQGLPEVTFTKLRQFFDHPHFIDLMVDSVQEGFTHIDTEHKAGTRLVFTAHSIPTAADNNSGIASDGPLYSTQVREAARLVAERVGIDDFDVVWQSRSGAPHIPWLEPDIVDHVTEIYEKGHATGAVVCPIGFVSDHIEVVWDLDTELAREAQEYNIPIYRCRTAGAEPEFADMIVDLIEEQTNNSPWARLGEVPARGCTVNGQACAEGCCAPSRRPTAS
ncbi:ferrochelatase [Corynebacterium aquilae]|uniref:Coproporphyrin III ferrochelatase n=1 Tax=Corynebacterium aquilae DSM 44791 TaxID=1431546 RepID=A0A1L7CFY5_9CORY|nr:ferrochelatase [Corynebacterium aquilae]APT84781.1 ferrochelatase [Corynebacterium aquilae DSM 44791]